MILHYFFLVWYFLWAALNQDRSKSASSLDSFKGFDAGAELAQLEDRLKIKLSQPSRALSCTHVAPPTRKKKTIHIEQYFSNWMNAMFEPNKIFQ